MSQQVHPFHRMGRDHECPGCSHEFHANKPLTKGPDTHAAVQFVPPKPTITSLEMVIITIPVTGWYDLTGAGKEIYLAAGEQLVLNAPRFTEPKSGTIRNKV